MTRRNKPGFLRVKDEPKALWNRGISNNNWCVFQLVFYTVAIPFCRDNYKDKDEDKDKDLFIGPQEFVVGYSKAPEQPQRSARPVCHSHAVTRTGCKPATIRTAA